MRTYLTWVVLLAALAGTFALGRATGPSPDAALVSQLQRENARLRPFADARRAAPTPLLRQRDYTAYLILTGEHAGLAGCDARACW